MKIQKVLLFGIMIFLWIGCSNEDKLQIEGTIDYVGSSTVSISKQAVHYKYADPEEFPIDPDEEGNFTVSVPVDSVQLVHLTIDDQSYPLVADPQQPLTVDIRRSAFPRSIDVTGYAEPWDSLLAEYRSAEQPVLQQISAQLPSFREGEPNGVIELYRRRYQLADEMLSDTPLQPLAYKAMGEYLVKRLENLRYRRGDGGTNPEQERRAIVLEARELGFFTFEALHAQRAGSRDFTHAFATTFGVADSLEREYGQELMSYDVKRLGYEKLDSARTSILPHIEERRAKAYARMHLVAERIGEMPLETATPPYEQYLREYEDYPRYTGFLTTFYEQIQRVSPGQPAIPFAIPDENGEIVTMEDFKGKYVLLDFWASWCIPCLDEFPHMNDLYERYPREQFEIAAISIEEDSLRWRQAIGQFDNPWPQLYAGEGFDQATFKAYRGGGIPFYMLIGPDGNILRYNDVRPSFNLEQVLDSLITPTI